MKKRNFCPMAAAVLAAAVILQPFSASAGALDQIRSIAKSVISGEPKEVEELRQMEVAQSDIRNIISNSLRKKSREYIGSC